MQNYIKMLINDIKVLITLIFDEIESPITLIANRSSLLVKDKIGGVKWNENKKMKKHPKHIYWWCLSIIYIFIYIKKKIQLYDFNDLVICNLYDVVEKARLAAPMDLLQVSHLSLKLIVGWKNGELCKFYFFFWLYSFVFIFVCFFFLSIWVL